MSKFHFIDNKHDGNSRSFRISVQGTILSSEDCAAQLKDESFIEENYNCLVSNSDHSTFGDEPDVIVTHSTDGFTLLGINSVSNVVVPTPRNRIVRYFFRFTIDFLIPRVVREWISDGIHKIAKALGTANDTSE